MNTVTIQQILKRYWGYNQFRPLQEDIIKAAMAGKDTLVLLPTGGGKSICFQVPALAKAGLCLVISPLIALMKDQVDSLKQKGIPALAIYSGMSFLEIKKTLQNAAYGNYKFLYVSPERIQTNLFLDMLPVLNISLLVVDEAHCIAQWGYDFRPPYLQIASLRALIPHVAVMALTASATPQIQDDICDKLSLPNQDKKILSWSRFQPAFERPNLSYSVFNVPAKQTKLLEILKQVNGAALVYCKSRRQTREVADLLRLHGLSADYYHAGLSQQDRDKKQSDWINNTIRVMVCTNAFGMGIDKPDVRVVVHYDVPDCLEHYYQEAGRAGRDGKRAYAVLLYNNQDIKKLQEQSAIRYPEATIIKQVYIAVMNHFQVPAGSGEGNSYDFDVSLFASAFKLNILTVTYAIKALEQENIILFNDFFFKPSTVVFTTNRQELIDFENQYPVFEPLLKGLLRSYEGIFDFPAIISENKLAKFIQTDSKIVCKNLRKLHDYGIISYQEQKEKPQITLLQNRMYQDNYLVNTAALENRKQHFEERINRMIGYIRQSTGCRSRYLANYFTGKASNACGICDLCINEKTIPVSSKQFNEMVEKIKNVTQNKAASVDHIVKQLSGIPKEQVWRVINFLLAEEKIKMDKFGQIYFSDNV